MIILTLHLLGWKKPTHKTRQRPHAMKELMNSITNLTIFKFQNFKEVSEKPWKLLGV